MDVLGAECDLIQSEIYKNSHFLGERNDNILYYDCSNYYFETGQENGSKKYGKSKEHRPTPIIQMELFMDRDGIPLAFSLFPGNANEQTSLKAECGFQTDVQFIIKSKMRTIQKKSKGKE